MAHSSGSRTIGTNEFRIRKMTKADLNAAVEIYHHCFPASLSLFTALGRRAIRRYFQQALGESDTVVLLAVSNQDGRTAGLAVGAMRPDFTTRVIRHHKWFFMFKFMVGFVVSRHVRDWLRRWVHEARRQDAGHLPEADPAPSGPHAYHTLVAVHPASQGHGVGKRLLHQLAQELFEWGAVRIWGRVHPSNEPSVKLHRACGWNIAMEGSDAVLVPMWLDRQSPTSPNAPSVVTD